jgi:ribosomal subunit interface protein
MQIQIHAQGIELPEPLRGYTERYVSEALERHSERLTRVDVYFKDQNSPSKNGIDKHCLVEARPGGMDPIAAEHDATEFRDAVHKAVQKLGRALESRFDKRRTH